MLTRLHHIGIAVRSAEEALHFYRDVLGLQVAVDRVVESEGVRGVLLPVGESEIELLEPVGTGGSIAKFIELRGPGLHHICFETDDCEGELAAVGARGALLIDRTPRPGLAGMIGFLHPKGNHGVLVELATPPAHTGERDHRSASPVPRGIMEIGVVVRDHLAAAATFARHFELGPLEGLSGWADDPGSKVSSLGIGGTRLTFLEPVGEVGRVADFSRSRGEGLLEVTLAVGEAGVVADRLRSSGISFATSAGGSEVFPSTEWTGGVNLRLAEGTGSPTPDRENQR